MHTESVLGSNVYNHDNSNNKFNSKVDSSCYLKKVKRKKDCK